jgi:hypothetical protein
MYVIAFVNIKFVYLALAVCLLVFYDLLLLPIVMFGCLCQALVLCRLLFIVALLCFLCYLFIMFVLIYCSDMNSCV